MRRIRAGALDAFYKHVAGKAVGDDDVALSRKYVFALDVADEVQPALAEHRESRLCLSVALFILGADRQKSDAGIFNTVKALYVFCAVVSKFNEVFGLCVDVCAAVDKARALAVFARDKRCKSRALYIVKRAEHKYSADKHGTRASRADKRVGAALAQNTERAHKRRIAFVAYRVDGRVVICYDLRCVDDLKAGAVKFLAFKSGAYLLLVAHRNNGNVCVLADRFSDAAYPFFRKIASEAVNKNTHYFSSLSR